MKNKSGISETPAGFYKTRRPEYFSDSEVTSAAELPKEVFDYELSKITTNQKQDEFETLCRRLAEKFICPNLIPQVGPTGGGDGKTDSETYPVSKTIYDRWFVQENGWNNNEKWAFAISAKAKWKEKLKDDVIKIIGTERQYTRIYFMTNQLPSSKAKKDIQDELIKKFNVDIIILDGKWISEKIFNNELINLAVDSLNLSDSFKKNKINIGPNDTVRLKRLKELEENISDSKRYFEYDFQLVEDALETSILSRMLEKPKDEVEGKFDRAIRFCKKVNNPQQWIRIYYQRAWTYANWYNDYASFLEDYLELKKRISENSNILEIELYYNLFNLLVAMSNSESFIALKLDIDLVKEKKDIYSILTIFSKKDNKPSSSLTAKTYKSILDLFDALLQDKNIDNTIIELNQIFNNNEGHIDYPYESFRKIIEHLGNLLPNNDEYDALIDNVAKFSEKRNSELVAGEIFLKRGGQKLSAGYFKEGIVYFGKAVLKLAKEESQNGMYLSLIGLARSYRQLGLVWSSNNCFVSASSIAFKSWYESGKINKRSFECASELLANELFIGRITEIITWYEIVALTSKFLELSKEELETLEMADSCLAIRILNTNHENDKYLKYFPDLFEKQTLWLSQNASLYKLGYIDAILKDYNVLDISNEHDLDKFFLKMADQPFVDQMIYESDFMASENIELFSTILGCKFSIIFTKDKNFLFFAEMLLAFLESFLSTSINNATPNTSTITVYLIDSQTDDKHTHQREDSSVYYLEIYNFEEKGNSKSKLKNLLFSFVAKLLDNNFFVKNIKELLENLFRNESVVERLELIFEHKKFTENILGDAPKVFFEDWVSSTLSTSYPSKRIISLKSNFPRKNKENSKIDINKPDSVRHDQIKVFSIIDDQLWNHAKWMGFGYFVDGPIFGIYFGYENIDFGNKIFDNWINKFGLEDKSEEIKITIIRGVNKNHPSWYRVHISNNMKKDAIGSNHVSYTLSRYHEITPSTTHNIDTLISTFKSIKYYFLYPAKLINNENQVEAHPSFNKAILKRELFIRDAWEIGDNDLDMVAIRKDDQPIIPSHVKDAPVLAVLKRINGF